MKSVCHLIFFGWGAPCSRGAIKKESVELTVVSLVVLFSVQLLGFPMKIWLAKKLVTAFRGLLAVCGTVRRVVHCLAPLRRIVACLRQELGIVHGCVGLNCLKLVLLGVSQANTPLLSFCS